MHPKEYAKKNGNMIWMEKEMCAILNF